MQFLWPKLVVGSTRFGIAEESSILGVRTISRLLAHARDPLLGRFEFQVEYRTDVYAEQRGLEQALYDLYPEAQAANGGFNRIRGISLSNPNIDNNIRSAKDFMEQLGR